jgi:putative GTP pyrophosphokinase
MTSKTEITPELRASVDAYRPRLGLLAALAGNLESHTRQALEGIDHIDRIVFRVKEALSYGRKSIAKEKTTGKPKYGHPLEDIEDQVAGRVLVFFRRDVDVVVGRLRSAFNRVEQVRKAPESHDAFAYESEHLVFIIPPHALPPGWESLSAPPTTFELQVRTLFMHAWAEPQHDIEYKAQVPLTDDERRKLAWAASNAWGGDAIFEQVLDSLAERSPGPSNASR